MDRLARHLLQRNPDTLKDEELLELLLRFAVSEEEAFQLARRLLEHYPGIAALLLAGMGLCFFAPNTREIAERFEPRPRYAAYAGVLLTVSLFFMGRVSSFLYFQF